jgi:heme-degrading monooxygenase HmoA
VVLEHAILSVRSSKERAFELAMQSALPLIETTPGFLDIEVRPSIETPGRYLLLVEWDSLDAHTQGFRSSDRYAEWKRRLHHFYEPFPLVEHYGEPVVSGR